MLKKVVIADLLTLILSFKFIIEIKVFKTKQTLKKFTFFINFIRIRKKVKVDKLIFQKKIF